MTSACGDADALITYLYGEGTEEQRERIEAHLVQCARCAEEVATLGATREQLAAWTPPDRALGFQITQTAADRSASGMVLPFGAAQGPSAALGAGPLAGLGAGKLFDVGHQPPSRWWHQPLPAWAQLAAAVAIFASGLAIGAARNLSTPTASAVTASAPAAAAVKTAATAATTSGAVSREDLAQVEARLHSEIAQVQTASRAAAEGVSLQRVTGLIADSEARQRKELDYRTSVIVTDFQNARQYDNNKFGLQLQQTKGVTQANTQNINTLARQVGWSPNASPYVP
ncbi:MAG TPA: zf-HC2 domain-containing protein [Vicinamibacterales bacterium]|nr:zf-HC2 domain-containing protein [Vicinamibacterales bacterium]